MLLRKPCVVKPWPGGVHNTRPQTAVLGYAATSSHCLELTLHSSSACNPAARGLSRPPTGITHSCRLPCWALLGIKAAVKAGGAIHAAWCSLLGTVLRSNMDASVSITAVHARSEW